MEIRNKKILITGGTGFIGTNLYHVLLERGVPKENICISRRKNDLRIRNECVSLLKDKDIVFHLAANIGGIGKHITQQEDIVYDNLIMNANIIDVAKDYGIQKLVLAGTACSYPSTAQVPLKEEDIWNGYPAKETAPYGLAKRMMMVQANACREQYNLDAVTLIPTNLYGKYDNFGQNAHVIPALIKKIIDAKQNDAKEIRIWGDGTATREFLYAEDAAKALILAAERYSGSEPINIGTGIETPIKDLVYTLCDIISYKGEIKWDTSMPNGSQRRNLDVSRAYNLLGFKAATSLDEGLRKTIEWYKMQAMQ